MFSTVKQRILLGLYIFIILSIPMGAYLASQYTNTKSSAHESKPTVPVTKTMPKTTTPAAKQLLSTSEQNTASSFNDQSSPTPQPSSPTVATSFGPTLSLKTKLEARPADNQATKLFVGIMEGTLSSNPKFLLEFTVDLPASGEYSNLSLAGLNPGSSYIALLKGSAQLATSSAFVMSPTVTTLNNGEAVNMLTGDLNEDNVINTADYTIVQKALGSTAKSANWNENADLNKDRVVNVFDLAIITNNIGKVGASGAWNSPIPKVATHSASLNSPPVGSPEVGGYWMWMPK